MPNSSETRSEKFNRQTSESFAALGRFVQSFENMVDAARTSIKLLLSKTGPDQILVSIVLHHQAFTAKPILDVFRAIVMETLDLRARLHPGSVTDDDARVFAGVLSQIFGEYDALARARNNLLHATWRIGWVAEGQDDFSEFFAHNQKVTKSGARAVDLPKTAKELDELSDRCNKMAEWIWLVHIGVTLGEGISRQFRYNKNKKTWEDARSISASPAEPNSSPIANG